MDRYQKYLILVGIIGLIGIPVFVIDYSNLAWANNKESYWGMIAMVALILAVIFLHQANELQKKLDREKEKQSKNNN